MTHFSRMHFYARALCGFFVAYCTNPLIANVEAATTFSLPMGTDQPGEVRGISSDGSVIVGGSGSINAWTWTEATGRQTISIPSGFTSHRTGGVSSDGRYVSLAVVRSTSPSILTSRFDRVTNTHELSGFYQSNTRSVNGQGISPDGGTLAAQINRGSTGITNELAVFTPGQGISSVAALPASTSVAPYVVTNGGTLIAGSLSGGGSQSAFRWTQSAGIVSLPKIDVNHLAKAVAGSDDGSILVGDSGVVDNFQAVRWEGNSLEVFPMPSGLFSSSALTISGDGAVAGGVVWQNSTVGNIAWLWSEYTETVILRDFLQSQGLTVPVLRSVEAISDDRRVIVGRTTEGYVYRVQFDNPFGVIPSPSASVVMASFGIAMFRRRRRIA